LEAIGLPFQADSSDPLPAAGTAEQTARAGFVFKRCKNDAGQPIG
jgi:hypothetical protein